MRKEKCFLIFAQAMEYDKIYEDGSLSFLDICRKLEIDPGQVELYLDENFGVTGEELVAVYRLNMTVFMMMRSDCKS
ncbi:MAG: hypothetical protein NC115_03810 [Bacteroidales bacterium]|nr:hypothetical protein [Bacteroides sp.]MCM1197712.1 hypothetical protein [Clostridium sp.]MCM1501776.1 hypothetical protein [Bacteroidales bacterium]